MVNNFVLIYLSIVTNGITFNVHVSLNLQCYGKITDFVAGFESECDALTNTNTWSRPVEAGRSIAFCFKRCSKVSNSAIIFDS